MARELTIRPIEPGDATAYLAVFEAVAAEGRWIGTELPIQPAQQARIRAAATDPPPDSFTSVAVSDGALVGFAHVGLDRGHAHLGMAIIDGFRGLGIGRRLLDECIGWCRTSGAHKIDLEVWPHNVAAIKLYERAGFAVEGRRRRHWRRNSGELWDSIEMSLVLDEVSPGSPHGDG
jgi:RimJ/RimL family protein N-acetyltransferase